MCIVKFVHVPKNSHLVSDETRRSTKSPAQNEQKKKMNQKVLLAFQSSQAGNKIYNEKYNNKRNWEREIEKELQCLSAFDIEQ